MRSSPTSQADDTPLTVDWLVLVRSSSGYDRQRAVEALGRDNAVQALPLLLERVNDWVPQVRAAAEAAVRGWLSAPYAADWARALDAVVALQSARRADHGALLADIARLLRSEAGREAVRQHAVDPGRSVRRYLAGLAWAAAGSDAERAVLLQQDVAGPDRLLARLAVWRRHTLADRTRFAEAALRSPFGPVRATGLSDLAGARWPGAIALARRLCFDDSAAVRSVAWGVVRHDAVEVGEVLAEARRWVDDGARPSRQRAAALHLLCGASAADALGRCERAADDPAAPLRKVALQALLAATEGDAQQGWLLRALADPLPKVQRLAMVAVERGAPLPDLARLVELARGHGTATAWDRTLHLLRMAPTWSRLHQLLQLAGTPASAERPGVFLAALRVWVLDGTNIAVAPTRHEALQLCEAWVVRQQALPDDLRERLAFDLRAFGVIAPAT